MKKVLAWAVALALVLSSFTMAFAGESAQSSKDFKDASQIQYTEAVDVMVATGIINGFPDGTFGPQKTVTRGQMAKMISCILNGGENVGDQYKSACPFADSKNHWAAGNIAFCAAEHIIDGRSADVFDPDADVTGTEVAKMALTSLGYDSQIQGYTGENWAAAVLKDAKKNDLFKGLDKSFVPGDPCSREAAAQILFNMLQANMVEYENGTSVSIGDDVSVVVASKIKDQEWPRGSKEDDNGDGVKQLYEEAFGGQLSQNPEDADAFGSPSHSWTYPDKKSEVGNYVASSDYEFTAEAAGFGEALKAYDEGLAEDYNATPAKLIVKSVKVNGVAGEEAAIGTGDCVKMFEAKAPATGAVEGATYYDVVVEQYSAARVSDVSTNVRDADAKNGVTAYVYLNGKKYNDTDIPGYDAETYVKDAVLAVALGANNKVLDSYVMEELVTGKVTAIDNDTEAVTIDGKDYEKATKYADATLVPGDNEYTLYDYNGYYLAADITEAAPEDVSYGVLLATDYEKVSFGYKFVAKIFTSEGKEEIIEITEDLFEEYMSCDDADATDDVLIAYTLDEEGVIKSIDEPATENVLPDNAKVGTNNVLAGKFVAEDTVVFLNEAEEPETGSTKPKDSKYAVYGLSDLAEASAIQGIYFTNKAEDTYTAILLSAPLQAPEKEESIFGFVTSVKSKTTSDGIVYTVGALANGEEVTYTSVAKKEATSWAAGTSIVEFVLDGDKNLKDIVALNDIKPVEDLSTFTDTDKIAKFSKGTEVKAVLNNALDMEGNKNFQVVEGAYVYAIVDGKVELSDVASIRASNDIMTATADLYQTEKDADHWNIVVYQETEKPAPAETYTITWSIGGDLDEEWLDPTIEDPYTTVTYNGQVVLNGSTNTVPAGQITFDVYERTTAVPLVTVDGVTVTGTPDTENANITHYTAEISKDSTIEVLFKLA